VSLINEALRKARQAAAEHEDQRNAGRVSQAYPSRGPRRGAGPAAVALVAILAGLAGAVGVWWIVGTASDQPDSTDASIASAAMPEGGTLSSTPSPVVGSDGAPADAAAGNPPATPQTFVPPSSPASPPPGPRPTAAPDPAPSAAAERPPEDPVKDAAPAATASGVRVFIMDADLGYASLSLGYIVFRPVRPFAEINGDDVYEGSEVEGFTVEKIEVDRVVLRDSRGPLELRVP
jgi:hypothetical protein